MDAKILPSFRRKDLSDDGWNRIKHHFPLHTIHSRGRPYDDIRTYLNGILWILRTGAPWRDLPSCYGKWNSVYKCFVRWQKLNIFETVLKKLSEAADMQDVSIDSTCCKAHQHSAGAKKGDQIRKLMNISD